MVAVNPPLCDFGRIAPDFTLPGTDGQDYSLEKIKGPNATLIIFICNHCPFVKAIIERLVADSRTLQEKGVGIAAIMSNDAENYPADSFDNMKIFASQHQFPFPYLYDETQSVARAYEAVCTPDFFGFNSNLELQYRGRLDEGRLDSVSPSATRELKDAMEMIARTGEGPPDQKASIGCSIKWRS